MPAYPFELKGILRSDVYPRTACRDFPEGSYLYPPKPKAIQGNRFQRRSCPRPIDQRKESDQLSAHRCIGLKPQLMKSGCQLFDTSVESSAYELSPDFLKQRPLYPSSDSFSAA